MAKYNAKILVVDDNEEILIALRLCLGNHFQEVHTEKNPDLIPWQIQNTRFDVILLDMNFKAGINTGNEGLYWLREILKHDPAAVIIFMTAYADIELAVRAIKEGATDFIEKPWDEEKLLARLLSAYKLRQSRLEIGRLKDKQKHLAEKIDQNYTLCIGDSPAMQSVLAIINKVAQTDANILILGENGTGKELIAREIHRRSKRSAEVFVSVDLGAITETLFESELFGHVRGAFTDARQDRAGRFEIASGGTLFLDEIGNIPPAMQAKLLTVIQNREVVRLGSNETIPIDIRLICATNRPINQMVQDKQFREDLLYRINTIQLDLPPLRERLEDIPALVDFFLNKYGAKYDKSHLRITPAAITKIKKHTWQGNIRELEHAIEKAIILCDGNIIDGDDFFLQSTQRSAEQHPGSLNLAENERDTIRKALRATGGNIAQAGRLLGISRKTLYNKLKKYGLESL
ncbi:MAG: sigma-54 dependent transcriptional regulator [Candidatus Neomarinimicrobiota bacterium]